MQAQWDGVLTSRSKHILFALGVDSADASEGRGSDLVSQATPFTVSCETNATDVEYYGEIVQRVTYIAEICDLHSVQIYICR